MLILVDKFYNIFEEWLPLFNKSPKSQIIDLQFSCEEIKQEERAFSEGREEKKAKENISLSSMELLLEN